jgi:hypothetical protein
VRMTSGFNGGEFTKTLRKVCTCQKLKFAFLLLEYCKIRECYAEVILTNFFAEPTVLLVRITSRVKGKILYPVVILKIFVTNILRGLWASLLVKAVLKGINSDSSEVKIYKLSIFSFSCLRRSVLIEHTANAWADLLVLLIVFCKVDKLIMFDYFFHVWKVNICFFLIMFLIYSCSRFL